jgi:hypothetical protein
MIKSVEDYISAWNTDNSELRRELLIRSLTSDAIYLDPHAPEPIQGIESMQALMEQFRKRFDHRLIPEGDLDRHHSVFRLRWRLQRDNGEILSRGLMVGDLAANEAIARIVQFVD